MVDLRRGLISTCPGQESNGSLGFSVRSYEKSGRLSKSWREGRRPCNESDTSCSPLSLRSISFDLKVSDEYEEGRKGVGFDLGETCDMTVVADKDVVQAMATKITASYSRLQTAP